MTDESPPLVLHSGSVRTADPECPVGEGLGRAHGRVQIVGSRADVLAAMPNTTTQVDLAGATVTPGLIDSHVHPLWGARESAGVDLADVQTPSQLQEVLRAEAGRLHKGEWLRGWNLDYAVYSASQPHRQLLDEAVGHTPVFLMFYDLHTALASTAALLAAGVDSARTFPDTSEIVVDADGVPTGELREPSAYTLVADAQPSRTVADEADLLHATFARMNAVGLTGCVVMDGTDRQLDVLHELDTQGQLTMRVDVFMWHRPEDDDDRVAHIIEQSRRHGRLWRVAGVKLFSDGVIDTGTAWLHQPDCCGQGRRGYWPDPERFDEVIRRYDGADLQLATHAVGDRAVSAVLDAYASLPPAPAHRPRRIEHLEVMSDHEISRLRGAGVVASMQPLHMQWREPDLTDSWASRLGASRATHGFRVRDVLESGAQLALGSDWPVASFDPRVGMAWATSRARPGSAGAAPFEPDQRLSNAEVLHGYTRAAALALGASDRGWLRAGSRADLTIHGGDPTTASATELVELPILASTVAGRLVYNALNE